MEKDTADLYRLLGVNPHSTQKEITSAYRKLALSLHPDKNFGNGQAQELMKHVNIAHKILSDPQLRKEYDSQRDEDDDSVPTAATDAGLLGVGNRFSKYFEDLIAKYQLRFATVPTSSNEFMKEWDKS